MGHSATMLLPVHCMRCHASCMKSNLIHRCGLTYELTYVQFALSRQQPKRPPQDPNPSSLHPPPMLAPSASSQTDQRRSSHATASPSASVLASPSASARASDAGSTRHSRVSPSSVGPQLPSAADADAMSAADAPSNQPTLGMDVGPADQRRVDEENRQLLSSMSPAQVGGVPV